MKIKIILSCLLIVVTFASKAQTITIPDANFVSWLQTNYPTCMNGNIMTTNCASIQNATLVSVSNKSISDLTGIEYFINLDQFYCDNNLLTTLPTLPNTVKRISCSHNQLTSLPSLPNLLQNLSCYNNLLTSLPALPSSLMGLWCGNNNISCFPIFPSSLYFSNNCNISGNPFTCLPNYVSAMDSTTLTYPLCINGNTVNNPHGCAQTVSINENRMDEILKVYPNPSNGKYYVKLSEGMKGPEININVYNLLGELILNTKTQSSISQIDLGHQPNGIYIIRINTSNQSFNQRLIKQ